MSYLVLLGSFCLGVLHSQNTAFCQEKQSLPALSEYLEMKLKRDHIPGLAACIINDGRIIWSRGIGFQDLERKIPMTPQSVMGIASITKLLTATSVMQLAERNKLHLSDPVNKYLPFKIYHPEYPNVDITIAQLLSHTASTSNGPSLWRSFSCEPQQMSLKDWTKAYFLPGGECYHKDGNFGPTKPGEGFLYSNAGYTLLAYVVEAVSGVPFGQYCRENIFIPLGMATTTLTSSEVPSDRLCTMYSYGYNMDLERDLMQRDIDCGDITVRDYLFPLCYYTVPTIGAGGFYSSVEELSHLLIALTNDGKWEGHAILDQKSTRQMFEPYVDSKVLPGQFAAFGLGAYAMALNNGEPVWGHTGADPGMSTFMLFNYETRIGAIVLANRFVDIRDVIEWTFAEGIGEYMSPQSSLADKKWGQYAKHPLGHAVVIRVVPNYLPGDSRIFIVGNHRYLGCWVSDGIALVPQRDRAWAKKFWFADSTKLEFKITRGGMKREAVTMDGKALPNHSFTVVKDTVVNILVEDWKDQAQQ